MKRRFLVFPSVLFVFVAMGFVPYTQQQHSPSTPSVYKLMEVTYLWDLLKQGYEPNKERDDTWLHEGFRSKYAMAKKYASIGLIETAFECPVFLRGPHKDGDMDFNSTTSFGYYNPEFILRLHDGIETALKNPIFKAAAKKVYEKDLKDMALIYHDTYKYMQEERAGEIKFLKTKYLAMMAKPGGTMEGSLQETFRGYDIVGFEVADKADAREQKERYNSYDGVTAPAFWLRRNIDGTSEYHFNLLKMVITEMEKQPN